jgi:hypothetical protein
MTTERQFSYKSFLFIPCRSLTLRAEHRLRVFENRVLRRIFGLKGAEVMGEWRKLHKEELRDLYSTTTVMRC